MSEMTFAEVRRQAPMILVYAEDCPRRGVYWLSPNRVHDTEYEDRPYSENFVEGDGSRQNPFTYVSAAPVSPHYAIVDLWFRYRSLTERPDAPPRFLMANDWVLKITPKGVVAANGHFTRLLPLE